MDGYITKHPHDVILYTNENEQSTAVDNSDIKHTLCSGKEPY